MTARTTLGGFSRHPNPPPLGGGGLVLFRGLNHGGKGSIFTHFKLLEISS